MAKKFYAVKTGRTPGVYGTWADCKAQVDGYSGAVYKSFPTAAEALAFVTGETKQVERSGVVAYVDGIIRSQRDRGIFLWRCDLTGWERTLFSGEVK